MHVRADCIRCILLRPSAPHGKSYGYWKTLENHWENMVSGPCRSKIKDSPPTVTFPGKERSQNLTFGNQCKTFGIHWENMVSMPCRSKSNNNSLRVPFLAKSDVKKKTALDLHVQAIRPDLQPCYMAEYIRGVWLHTSEIPYVLGIDPFCCTAYSTVHSTVEEPGCTPQKSPMS